MFSEQISTAHSVLLIFVGPRYIRGYSMISMHSPALDYEFKVGDHGYFYYCLIYYLIALLCGVAFASVMLWGVPHLHEYTKDIHSALPLHTQWTIFASGQFSRFWVFAGCAGILVTLPPCIALLTLRAGTAAVRRRISRQIVWCAVLVTLLANLGALFSMLVALL
jgi:hypothetical protein